MMGPVWLRPYGAASTIAIALRKSSDWNYAAGADWTPAAGDVKVSKDGGAGANIASLPTANSTFGEVWEINLSAAELTCKSLLITVVDSATKKINDDGWLIETVGHPASQHPGFWHGGIFHDILATQNQSFTWTRTQFEIANNTLCNENNYWLNHYLHFKDNIGAHLGPGNKIIGWDVGVSYTTITISRDNGAQLFTGDPFFITGYAPA